MKSPRSKRNGRIGMLIATATLALGLTAPAAMASSANLSPAGPYAAEATVTAYGEAPPTAEFVAVALCNSEFSPGTHCDAATAVLDTAVAYEAKEVSLVIRKGPWADFDFTKGTPPKEVGSETTCNVAGKCEVQVSYYTAAFKQVGEDAVPVTFK